MPEAATEIDQTDLFISYGREDIDKVRKLADALKRSGFTVWWDINLKEGESWEADVTVQLRRCRLVICLLSTKSVAIGRDGNLRHKKNFHAEYKWAEKNNRLFPVRIEAISDFDLGPAFILDTHVDVVEWFESGDEGVFSNLINRLRGRLKQEDQAPAEVVQQVDKKNLDPLRVSGTRPADFTSVALIGHASVDVDDHADAGAVAIPRDERAPRSPAAPLAFDFTPDELGLAEPRDLLAKARRSHALADIILSGRSGQPLAQLIAGIAATEGEAGATDLAAAGRWLRRAAEAGEPRAIAEYAAWFGEFAQQSSDLAPIALWSRRARDSGGVRGRTIFAIHHLRGIPVGTDDAEAFALLSAAARSGDMLAATYLGWSLVNGVGAAPDLAAAARWLRRAAEAGNALAQANYGRLLVLGRGVERDDVKAVHWFRQAARQGHVWGEYYLGWALQRGLGTRRDLGEARYWFERSAKQGDSDAQVALATLCIDGHGGPRDLALAGDNLEAAAAANDGRAQFMLGEILENGRSRPVDLARAAELYRAAAENGNAHAALHLGLMYDWGRGVSRDVGQARRFLAVAASQYHDAEVRVAAERRLGTLGTG